MRVGCLTSDDSNVIAPLIISVAGLSVSSSSKAHTHGTFDLKLQDLTVTLDK